MFESELSSALSTVWVRTAERVLHRSTLAEMVEPLADQAAEMVLCVSCSDAVPAGVPCATSGAAGQGAVTAPDVDEALLDQVGVALAAHAALARRTATRRVETASRLYEEAVVLRSRLRRQAALLRARLDERRGLLPAVVEALDHVEEALAQARGPEDVGGP